jgi:hypothetical protein
VAFRDVKFSAQMNLAFSRRVLLGDGAGKTRELRRLGMNREMAKMKFKITIEINPDFASYNLDDCYYRCTLHEGAKPINMGLAKTKEGLGEVINFLLDSVTVDPDSNIEIHNNTSHEISFGD